MQKIYKYRNATVYVVNPADIDRNVLQKATEKFLRKVLEENNNGDSNKTRDFRKEQVLD